MMSEEKINAVADPETTIERTEPWLAEISIRFLTDEILRFSGNVNILETGMGGSTAWLINRCKCLVSIEHDEEWFNKVTQSIGHIITEPGCEHQMLLAQRPYNNKIDELKDNSFDIILIDGRDRVKCTRSAIPKLKSGGWLILDNSERPYYQPGIDLMKGWNRIDCKQEKPDKYGFTYPDWTTSIFIKP